jgi:putative oxidoreductase
MSTAIEFTARLLLVLLFLPFSALDKVLNFDAAVDQAAQAAGTRSLARLLIFAGFGIEVLMSAGILSGVADRLAALVLSAYCVLTAFLWKQFWALPGFALRGPSAARGVFWDFLKNLSVAGGFLLLAVGAHGAGLARCFAHPLESTHPYGVPASIAPE